MNTMPGNQILNFNNHKLLFWLVAAYILFIYLPFVIFAEQRSEKLIVHFFGSETCGSCHKIKEEVLKPLAQKYHENLDVRLHDIENKADYQLLIKMERFFNVPQSLPEQFFLPDTFLSGYEEITDNAKTMIEEYLSKPEKWIIREFTVDTSSYSEILKEKFQEFTFLGIFLAGLVDGINPCAIATIIFLISFLSTQKRKPSEVLAIGLSFTAAVFITYLLIGLGLFKVLTMLSAYYWVSKVIRWSAIILAAGVGILSFYDALSYKLSGKTSEIKLQLPKAIKLRIHKVISTNLKRSQLIFGSIITGFLVTLLEAVCTGQVYLPTIVLMTRKSGLKLTGWLYLIFYNFLFVLPLLIIMVLAYFGLSWSKLAKTTQKHLTFLKILLGIVLFALAFFLYMST